MQQYLGRPSARKGIFMEINSTTERPVTRIPDHFQPLADAGYEIILHQQKIADNLKTFMTPNILSKWEVGVSEETP